ncbi:thermonuclease family protein [Desulfospira joergensenii]|uniref:thermonuclease family protein n=1 Tax=Desulfospira joergensenii TaxID=53329 RepID=UPI0003B45FEB|nr:thermonuclease family protein [Desulfospira joergensenii]
MNLKFTTLFTGLVLFLSIVTAQGDVYFWTDESGVKHFSNIGPPKDSETDLFEEEVRLEQARQEGRTFRVTKVYDGDTLLVQGSDLELKIRLAGIDSPETGYRRSPGQPYGQKAKAKLSRLVNGRDVILKSHGIGGFNRILAEVFSGSTNINLEMIRAGLAEVYRGRTPATLDTEAYFREEKKARKAGMGMWALGRHYKSPRAWRKEHPRK